MANDKSVPPRAERRPKTRKRVLLTGIVTFDEGDRSFDCTFYDLSETGARITVAKNAKFPPEFYLINIRDRCAYQAKLVWNNGSEVGITFQKALPLADVDPRLAYLKRMWMAKATR